MRKNPLVFAFAIGLTISINASGYRPSGWTYGAWPYVYDAPSQSWYYMNESDTQWCVEMFTGQWRTLGFSPMAAGWTYWQWPYAFDLDSGTWCYLNESDVQWCCILSSGTWSRFGEASAANVAGNWQFTATHDGGTGTGTLTIQQSGSALTAQTPLGTYSGSVSGSTVTLRGPGEEVDEMEWVMTLNDVNNPTQMSGTWTDIENGQRTGSGPLSTVRI